MCLRRRSEAAAIAVSDVESGIDIDPTRGALPPDPDPRSLIGWRSLVLVEDDAGDALLVTEMLLDVAPDVQLTSFTTLQAALDAWPAGRRLRAARPRASRTPSGSPRSRSCAPQVPDVPVVVLTGRVDDGIGPQALAAGAQDFLVKGQVDGPGLERSLRYAVERGRATAYQRDLVAAELRAQENTRLQRGLLPSPLIADRRARRWRCSTGPGSERALLGGDFYDVVQTPTGRAPAHRRRQRARSRRGRARASRCGSPGGRWCWPGCPPPTCCGASSRCCSPSGTTTSGSPPWRWSSLGPDLRRPTSCCAGTRRPLLDPGRRGRRARRSRRCRC